MNQLQLEIREIVAEIIEVTPEEIELETHFTNDLDADSMHAIEIITDLEERYDISIDHDHISEILTLEKVTKVVDKLR